MSYSTQYSELLNGRIHKCDIEIDRDLNASLNILKKGLEYLPLEKEEVMLISFKRTFSKFA